MSVKLLKPWLSLSGKLQVQTLSAHWLGGLLNNRVKMLVAEGWSIATTEAAVFISCTVVIAVVVVCHKFDSVAAGGALKHDLSWICWCRRKTVLTSWQCINNERKHERAKGQREPQFWKCTQTIESVVVRKEKLNLLIKGLN